MTSPAEAIFADALGLDRATRAELAAQLVASLDGAADPDAQAAWSREIEERVAGIEAGTIPVEDWETVRARIEGRLRKR